MALLCGTGIKPDVEGKEDDQQDRQCAPPCQRSGAIGDGQARKDLEHHVLLKRCSGDAEPDESGRTNPEGKTAPGAAGLPRSALYKLVAVPCKSALVAFWRQDVPYKHAKLHASALSRALREVCVCRLKTMKLTRETVPFGVVLS